MALMGWIIIQNSEPALRRQGRWEPGRGSLPCGQAVGRRVSQFAPSVWNRVIAQRRLLGFHSRRQCQLPLARRKRATSWLPSDVGQLPLAHLNLPSNRGLAVGVTCGFPEGEYSSSRILGSKQECRGFCVSVFAWYLPCWTLLGVSPKCHPRHS